MEIHTGGILMKKIFSVMLSALICICPINFMNTYAYSFTQEEIDSSPIKPQLSLSRINISESKAKENPEIKISLTLSGAEGEYSSAEIWTSFDSRLTVKKDSETGENYFEFNAPNGAGYIIDVEIDNAGNVTASTTYDRFCGGLRAGLDGWRPPRYTPSDSMDR